MSIYNIVYYVQIQHYVVLTIVVVQHRGLVPPEYQNMHISV